MKIKKEKYFVHYMLRRRLWNKSDQAYIDRIVIVFLL